MEVGDLLCMIDLLLVQGIISQSGLDLAKEHKKNKLKIWSNIFKEEAE
jgi:hypothetical protein